MPHHRSEERLRVRLALSFSLEGFRLLRGGLCIRQGDQACLRERVGAIGLRCVKQRAERRGLLCASHRGQEYQSSK